MTDIDDDAVKKVHTVTNNVSKELLKCRDILPLENIFFTEDFEELGEFYASLFGNS